MSMFVLYQLPVSDGLEGLSEERTLSKQKLYAINAKSLFNNNVRWFKQ